MNLSDRSRPLTVEQLIERYNLDALKDNAKVLKTLDDQLTKTYGNIKKYITQMVTLGSTTQYFMSGVPTLTNEPAKNWDETNYSFHTSDLYYDKDTGTAYIFVEKEGKFGWEEIDDNVLESILAIASSEADTSADSQRSVFNVKPKSYYVGDIWVNGQTIYRCQRTSEEFNMDDWIPYQQYTDAMALNNAVRVLNDFKLDVLTNYVTSALLETTACAINAVVQKVAIPLGENNQIFKEQPTTPYLKGDMWFYNNNIYTCVESKDQGEFDTTNWVLASYPTTKAEIIAKVNDTTSEVKINADVVNITAGDVLNILSGNSLNLTSKNITINSTNFNVDKDGNVTCNNLNATNGNFSGNITGSTITGSNLFLTSSGNDPKITIVDKDNSNIKLSLSASISRFLSNSNVIDIITSGIYPHINLSNGNKTASFSPNGFYTYGDSSVYGKFNCESLKVSSSNGGATITSGNPASDTTAGDYGVWISGSGNITLNPGKHAYIRIGTSSSYLISTAGGNTSSRNLKENIKEFEEEKYIKALNVLDKIKIYDYDYKYKVKETEEDNKNHFGFIIDEIENIENANEFFKFKETKAVVTEDGCLDEQEANEHPESENIIDYKRYDEESLIKYLLVVCKAQQHQIDELKTLIKEGK